MPATPLDHAYLGCYTAGAGGEGVGIVLARRGASGGLVEPRLVARTPSPSFLARHPRMPVLYAVNELAEGAVSAFRIGAGGGLVSLGSWPTGGELPCHLAAADGCLYVANYGTGSIAVFPLDPAGVPTGRGDLVAHSGHGADPRRQTGPHAHMVSPLPGVVFAVDLGTDAILAHPADAAAGRLGPGTPVATLPPGTGPRHLQWDGPDRVHVVAELDPVVVSYEVTPDGWRRIGQVPASSRPGHVQPSGIVRSPDGRFLYVGNRGVDTVRVFSLSGGEPRPVAEVAAGGSWPRHLVAVDGVLDVANERSHTVVSFRRDPGTGVPEPTGEALATPSPTCVLPVALQ